VQCVPIKRESWSAEKATLTAEEAQRVHDLTKTINRQPGYYRRQFRA